MEGIYSGIWSFSKLTLGTTTNMDVVKVRFMAKFQRPNSKWKSYTKMEEIKQLISKSGYEYDQCFQDLISIIYHPTWDVA